MDPKVAKADQKHAKIHSEKREKTIPREKQEMKFLTKSH